MSFRTKLDYSDNRQIQQRTETHTILSGGTTFGVPFSALTTGPDLLTSGITSFVNSVNSTFSGNSATTVFNWYTPIMELGNTSLTAITPSTSANTQYTTGYSANTTTVIDGNTVVLDYVGVYYDITCSSIYDLGGGNYSGTAISSEVDYLSAEGLGFTGRTIWADVSGITRTENLIITNSPVIGYVWTCEDSEGKGYWSPVSATSTTSIWISGTGINSAILNGGGGLANGSYSVSEGYNTRANGNFGSHAEGYQTTASGSASHAQGDRTRALSDYSHAGGQSVTAYGLGSFVHSNGNTLNSSEYGVSGDSSAILGGQFNKIFLGGDLSAIIGGTYNVIYTGTSNSIILGGSSITATTSNTTYVDNLNIQTIGVGPGTSIAIDGAGQVVYTTSDIRLKENISTLTNALDKVKNLRGVKFQLKNRITCGDDFKIGFIAQEVNEVVPELTFVNKTIPEQYMGVHYENVTALLVEAIKEIATGSSVMNNTVLNTQTVVAEDNNIDLNFGGTQQTAIDGGVRILHAKGVNLSADFLIDENGDWVTNNDLKPKQITIPLYTPSGSTDTNGGLGNITRDDAYIYVKCSDGWKRSNLESF